MQRIEHVLGICRDLGIEFVTVFAWSTENWSRPQTEVNRIISLLESNLPGIADRLNKENARFVHSGDLSQLTPRARDAIEEAVEATQDNGPPVFNLAFNYGGRRDILNAVQTIVSSSVPPEAITEDTIARNLWSHPLPDIDLLIRSGGERRLSNFMLWQMAYADMYFTDVLWPDIGREEIAEAIQHYSREKRLTSQSTA